jgi:SAM-dependent methyltransferase
MTGSASPDFLDVTETTDSPISIEQFERLVNRYRWAAGYCKDKDVVEVACGVGPGLGLLSAASRSLQAGDVSQPILDLALDHYRERISLSQFDAEALPFADASKDVIILFEAIYYLPHAEQFVSECRRILRAHGDVLISTANKDIWDFHVSPHTHTYFGVRELYDLLSRFGFDCTFFGFQPVDRVPLRQKLLRPLKRAAVSLGVMPKTMKGKRWLKRLVFGPQQQMPTELTMAHGPYSPPMPISAHTPDRRHKVIYCAARRRAKLA